MAPSTAVAQELCFQQTWRSSAFFADSHPSGIGRMRSGADYAAVVRAGRRGERRGQARSRAIRHRGGAGDRKGRVVRRRLACSRHESGQRREEALHGNAAETAAEQLEAGTPEGSCRKSNGWTRGAADLHITDARWVVVET